MTYVTCTIIRAAFTLLTADQGKCEKELRENQKNLIGRGIHKSEPAP